MYINFHELQKSGLEHQDLFFLVAIKQKEEEHIQEYYNGDVIEDWLEKGWIKKLKKGEIRIDTKGTKLLTKISTSSKVTEDTERIVQWLIKVYKSKDGGIVKNKTETARRCQWFSDETGLQKNKLALLLKCFIEDSYSSDSGVTIIEAKRQNPRLVLSQMVDNIFWSPPNHFSRIYKLDESPLYRYYEDNVEYVEQMFQKNGVDV